MTSRAFKADDSDLWIWGPFAIYAFRGFSLSKRSLWIGKVEFEFTLRRSPKRSIEFRIRWGKP